MIRPALMILAALGVLGVFVTSACNGTPASSNSATTAASATVTPVPSNFSELARQSGLIGRWNGTCTIYYSGELPQTYNWFEFSFDGTVKYGSSQPPPKHTEYEFKISNNSKPTSFLINDSSGDGDTFTRGPQYFYSVSGDRLTMTQQWKNPVPSCTLIKATPVVDEKAMQRSTPPPPDHIGPLAGRWNGPCEIVYHVGTFRTYDWIEFRSNGTVILGTNHPPQTEERRFGLNGDSPNPGFLVIDLGPGSPPIRGPHISFKVTGSTLSLRDEDSGSPAKRCTLTKAA